MQINIRIPDTLDIPHPAEPVDNNDFRPLKDKAAKTNHVVNARITDALHDWILGQVDPSIPNYRSRSAAVHMLLYKCWLAEQMGFDPLNYVDAEPSPEARQAGALEVFDVS